MASAAAPAPSPSGAPRWRRRLRLVAIGLPIAALLLFGLYLWAALNFAYSDGERAGYVQKFSRKGWICKTWEGELAMVSLPGTLPEVFRFTVHSDDVAKAINATLGQRVSLHYEQHVGLPTSCWGETQYFVTGVRAVGQ
jgi:hypothetical protein